jgi:hypothetical protein
MKKSSLLATALVAASLSAPVLAQAQGLVGGAEDGARRGERVGGPVGGVVGGAVGAGVGAAEGAVGVATGVVGGVLGVDTRPRFREYVVRERHPSYAYREEVRVGTVLPGTGVTYYEVPSEYGVRNYRYTVVNNRTVLVDPATHRIVEIVD